MPPHARPRTRGGILKAALEGIGGTLRLRGAKSQGKHDESKGKFGCREFHCFSFLKTDKLLPGPTQAMHADRAMDELQDSAHIFSESTDGC